MRGELLYGLAELISLLSIFKVTLPLKKFNPLPLEPGEVFQVSQGQKKFLQNANFYNNQLLSNSHFYLAVKTFHLSH